MRARIFVIGGEPMKFHKRRKNQRYLLARSRSTVGLVHPQLLHLHKIGFYPYYYLLLEKKTGFLFD